MRFSHIRPDAAPLLGAGKTCHDSLVFACFLKQRSTGNRMSRPRLLEEDILLQLPPPPSGLPKPTPEWTAINNSSTRFAVSALRKSAKLSLNKCRKLISTTKEGERLQTELDRVAKQVKIDMTRARVPRVIMKDCRVGVLEDFETNVEQLSKTLKVSRFMEEYLKNVRAQRREAFSRLQSELDESSARRYRLPQDFYPSSLDMATRVNRSCPKEFTLMEAALPDPVEHGQLLRSASTCFLFNCQRSSKQSPE